MCYGVVYVYCEINFEWVVFATGECVEDQTSAFEHEGLRSVLYTQS